MNTPNYDSMTFAELRQCADYAADWLDERGFTISDLVDLRKCRQDHHFLKGVCWAFRERLDDSVAAQNKAAGMNGRVGTEA